MTTVVVIPGSFAPAKLYDNFKDSLIRDGIQTEVIELPSVGRRDSEPPHTMTDDVNEIIKVVSKLLDQGREVIMLSHSYGGIPMTQSLEKLSIKAREKEGKPGGVKKIIFMAAIVLQVGTSNFELFGDNLPESLVVEDDFMKLDPQMNATLTFSDMPVEEGLVHGKDMIYHSTPSFKEKLTYPGYNDAEVHYIVCEEDKVVPAQFQYAMIELVKASSGKEVGVHRLQSGHAPTVSQPDNVVKVIRGII